MKPNMEPTELEIQGKKIKVIYKKTKNEFVWTMYINGQPSMTGKKETQELCFTQAMAAIIMDQFKKPEKRLIFSN